MDTVGSDRMQQSAVKRQAYLDRRRPEPLHAQLKQILQQQIVNGDIAAGEKLPTEMELVAQYNVSRVTVRRTLGELAREGYLDRRAGVGTTVRPRIFWDRRSQRLYGFFDDLRAQGLDARTVVVSVAHGRCTRAEADLLGISVGQRVTRVRQIGYVDREPISVADITLSLPPAIHLDPARLVGEPSVYQYLEREHGIVFHQAGKTLAAREASAEDAEILQIPVGKPVLVAEVVAHIDSPKTSMLILTRYRGDRYRYYVALTN